MRFAQVLFASMLTLATSITSFAEGVSSNNFDNLEAEVAKAQALADFSADYQKHLEMKDARRKAVRGTFSGDFKFRYSTCILNGNGVNAIGGIYSSRRGGAQDANYECDCPKGTRKLGCLVSAKSTTRFAKEDMGGVGYVMLFADDGDKTYLLIDNQWQDFIAIRKGKSTYTVPVVENKGYEYNIPFNRRLCGNSSGMALGIGQGKSYSILAGYGVADTMDLKYLEATRQHGSAVDEKEFLWSSARLDGFRMRNARPIGMVTCN